MDRVYAISGVDFDFGQEPKNQRYYGGGGGGGGGNPGGLGRDGGRRQLD